MSSPASPHEGLEAISYAATGLPASTPCGQGDRTGFGGASLSPLAGRESLSTGSDSRRVPPLALANLRRGGAPKTESEARCWTALIAWMPESLGCDVRRGGNAATPPLTAAAARLARQAINAVLHLLDRVTLNALSLERVGEAPHLLRKRER